MSGTGEHFDVAVVGAGIIGLGAALAAVRRGLRVVVVSSAAARRAAPRSATSATSASPRRRVSPCGMASPRARSGYGSPATLGSGCASRARSWSRGPTTNSPCSRRLPTRAAARSTRTILRRSSCSAPRRHVIGCRSTRARSSAAPTCRPTCRSIPGRRSRAIRAHLAARGVEFRTRTTVGGDRVGPSSRRAAGRFDADRIIVAVNHDIDLLYPEVAERIGIVRCGLDMLRVRADPGTAARSAVAHRLVAAALRRVHRPARGIRAPRATAPGTARSRCARPEPDVHAAARRQPHRRRHALPGRDGRAVPVRRGGRGSARGVRRAVRRRAPPSSSAGRASTPAGPTTSSIVEVEPGVHLAAATTGIGMTTGLGLAEHIVDGFADEPRRPAPPTRTKGIP